MKMNSVVIKVVLLFRCLLSNVDRLLQEVDCMEYETIDRILARYNELVEQNKKKNCSH
jgi:hypothetical protein